MDTGQERQTGRQADKPWTGCYLKSASLASLPYMFGVFGLFAPCGAKCGCDSPCSDAQELIHTRQVLLMCKETRVLYQVLYLSALDVL